VQSIFSECGPEVDSFEVYGESGTLGFDRYFSEQVEYAAAAHGRARLQRLSNRVRSFVPRRGWIKKVRAPIHEPSYEASVAHFASAIRGHESPEYDLMDGYKSVMAIAAAEQSAGGAGFVACDRTIALGL